MIEQKYTKLLEIREKMLDDKKIRPDCEQLLNNRSDWYLSLNDLKDDKEFKKIIISRTKTNSLEECFHYFFIQQKHDFFVKSKFLVSIKKFY